MTDRPSVGDKVRFLSNPESYPHVPRTLQVIETHMSWVFLADDRVFKLKKPVRYEFLDFSTTERRRQAVADETRLNRRLAPHVYHDPLPLGVAADGTLSLGGSGRIVDWLVVMRRLADDLNLERIIGTGRLTPHHVAGLAGRLVTFYRDLPPEDIAADDYVGQFASESRITRSALTDPALSLNGPGLSPALDAFDAALDGVRPLLRRRAREGRVVEGHGDLRPQHVFLEDPPVIIDCLEFNRGLRTVDPFDEIAFLAVESVRLGAEGLFAPLASRLAKELDDRPPPELLSFYWRYRALLRARLALLHLADDHPRTPDKWRPLARRYVDLSMEADLRTRLPEDP